MFSYTTPNPNPLLSAQFYNVLNTSKISLISMIYSKGAKPPCPE